jgi:hypothetical protein
VGPPDVIAKLNAGTPLTDDDIGRTLDGYDLVGTLEKRQESLVLMKLLLPMVRREWGTHTHNLEHTHTHTRVQRWVEKMSHQGR